MKIIPAILSNNPSEVKELMYTTQEAGVDRVHIDIIDGVFANNKTVDPVVVEEIDTTLKIDFHLMTKDPINWVEKCIRSGADRIIAQVEMMSDQVKFVEKVSGFGMKVGLALDINTPVSIIDEVIINDLDTVLVMSVPAGFGGHEFDFKVLEKIKELNNLREDDSTPFSICDDGGITVQTIDDVAQLKVEEVVIGRRIYEGDLIQNIQSFQEASKKGPRIKQIAIFGFADAAPNDPLYKEAYECAKYLAQKGLVLINGGGPGVMRAVSEGAKDAGGDPIVVTFYPKDITNFEGRDPNNPAKIEIKARNYLERTLKLLEFGDVYIVFRGGTGTISEFGMAWGLARLYFGHHKPLILYGDYWHDIIKSFEENMRIRPEDLKVCKIVSSPEEAHRAIQSFEEAIKVQEHAHRDEKAFQL